eukprot:909992-Prorocentrum_minimum.AAC.1
MHTTCLSVRWFHSPYWPKLALLIKAKAPKQGAPPPPQARAVVLAGGTLQPVRELAVQLFPSALAGGRVRTVSCAHIVPDEHLLGLALSCGPSGHRFHLTHQVSNVTNTNM